MFLALTCYFILFIDGHVITDSQNAVKTFYHSHHQLSKSDFTKLYFDHYERVIEELHQRSDDLPSKKYVLHANGVVEVHGWNQPQLVLMDRAFEVMASTMASDKDLQKQIYEDLFKRGFPPEELKKLNHLTDPERDLAHVIDLAVGRHILQTQPQLMGLYLKDDLAAEQFSDGQIKLFLDEIRIAKQVAVQDYFLETMLAFSQRAERILVAYLYETFVSQMTTFYFQETSDGTIDNFRHSFSNSVEVSK